MTPNAPSTDFFTAPNNETAAACGPSAPVARSTPSRAQRSTRTTPWEVGQPHHQDTGRPTGLDDRPRPASPIHNDDALVIGVSDQEIDWLSAADAEERADLARRWARLRQADGDDLTEEHALAYLTDLAALAARTAARGWRLYGSFA